MTCSRALIILATSAAVSSWAMGVGAQWYPRYGSHGNGGYRHYPHRYHPRPEREWQNRFLASRSDYGYQPGSRPHTDQNRYLKARKDERQRSGRDGHNAPKVVATQPLYGGRQGESMAEQDDGSLLIRIPGYRGERFDVQLTSSQTITLRSLSRRRERGYGYTRRFQLPLNAETNAITAVHLRGSGLEIRIPTYGTDKTKAFQTVELDAHTSNTQAKTTNVKNSKVRTTTLADRLNRGWDDPEGSLIDEDYSVGDNDAGPIVQVVELGSSMHEPYAKDADAIAGYVDVRGSWQSY